MIYLITGNMGTGKTSRAVNMILTNEDDIQNDLARWHDY